MTYASLLSCSVVMSKFMQIPRSRSPTLWQGRSRVSLSARPEPQSSNGERGLRLAAGRYRRRAARGRRDLSLERLDRLFVLGLQRTVGIDLEVSAQRIELDLAVAGVRRCRCEQLQVRRVPGMDLHGGLVGLDGLRGRGRRTLVEPGGPGRGRLRSV